MRILTVNLTLSLTLALVGVLAESSFPQQPSESARKIVNRVTPLYPDLARRMQISGTVKVEALVAPNGRVKSTKVIGGSPVLTKAALDAIGAWKWASTSSESKELIELTFRPN